MKIRTRALVALTTTALALTLASPAEAATKVRDDARNDVVRGHLDDAEPTPAPAVKQGDIRRLVVDHRAHNVVVTARFNDLVRGQQFHASVLQLLTADRRRDVQISVEPGGRAQGTVEFTDRRGRVVRCGGLATRIDWSANVIRTSVPRSCLGNPRWVRAGYGYLRINKDLVMWADDAYRNGTVGDTLAFGPRVLRG